MAHVAFVLGKPPKASTIFPEVFDRLGVAGVRTSVHLPHDADVDEDLATAELVVHRGLSAASMRALPSARASARM